MLLKYRYQAQDVGLVWSKADVYIYAYGISKIYILHLVI